MGWGESRGPEKAASTQQVEKAGQRAGTRTHMHLSPHEIPGHYSFIFQKPELSGVQFAVWHLHPWLTFKGRQWLYGTPARNKPIGFIDNKLHTAIKSTAWHTCLIFQSAFQ